MEHQTNELGISNPGKGKDLISPSQAIEKNPDFFAKRPADVNWSLKVRHLDGTIEELPPGTDWEAVSKFGAVRSAVVANPDGSPAFDRPRYDEAPNINAVAWGKDKKTGEIKIGIISQARPHADNVFEDSDKPMTFESVPMGFKDKIIGKDQIERLENTNETAARETVQETGAQAVLDISYPEYPHHYPNPTFVGTTSEVVFVEVDLEAIDNMKIDRKELIFSADYIPLKQLLEDIKAGKTERGYARMATSNSVILMFLSTLSAYQNAERNQNTLSKQGQLRKTFKHNNPAGYAIHMSEEAVISNPEKAKEIKTRTESYLSKLQTKTQPEEITPEINQKPVVENKPKASFPKPVSSKSLLDRIKFWKRA